MADPLSGSVVVSDLAAAPGSEVSSLHDGAVDGDPAGQPHTVFRLRGERQVVDALEIEGLRIGSSTFSWVVSSSSVFTTISSADAFRLSASISRTTLAGAARTPPRGCATWPVVVAPVEPGGQQHQRRQQPPPRSRR